MRLTWVAATLALICSLGKVSAHEFWIDPTAYQVAPGEPVIAHLRVGQEFRGAPQAYLPSRFKRFEVYHGAEVTEPEARLGDIPALELNGLPDGLAIVAHETTSSTLTYREWERFVSFVEHKDLSGALEAHLERGLSQEEFRESFSRHVKSLIGVGSAAGADRELGLETEIVALANPYTDTIEEGLPVRVLRSGVPRANAQVELFEQDADGVVTITLHRTGPDGIVALPVSSGNAYLVDAVVLEPREAREDRDPVWHSYWAALTFAVP